MTACLLLARSCAHSGHPPVLPASHLDCGLGHFSIKSFLVGTRPTQTFPLTQVPPHPCQHSPWGCWAHMGGWRPAQCIFQGCATPRARTCFTKGNRSLGSNLGSSLVLPELGVQLCEMDRVER
jgi:hypothetical protein